MDRLMSKGLLTYTAMLFLTAIASFVIAMPQHSVFAGMATLAAITIVLVTRAGREMQTTAVTSEPRD